MRTVIDSNRMVLVLALAVFAIGSITPDSLAYASDHQNGLDGITDIEFRTATDFHTYLPGSELSFNVECNQLAGEFAIGFNTFIQKSDGSPADVNDVRNLVFLQRGSSEAGAIIDAVNTGHDTLKLTAEVTCAKLLPVSLPTVPDAPTDLGIVTGDQQAILTWEAPLFDGNSTITKYQVSAMPDPRTESADDVFDETVDTSFTFDSLVNGITYKFQVTAVNDVGPGISSEIITGTPLGISLPPITLTTYPTSDPTGKTVLCHNDKVTLSLPTQAVRAHLENHDDYLGECSDNTSTSSSYPTSTYPISYPTPAPAPTSTPEPTTKTAVCHNDKTTLSLPANAVRAHLENHGDYLGECSDHTSTPQETSKRVVKQQDRDADKAQREADRLAQQAADKAQREADRLAQQAADKAQREADRLAQQAADKSQREAERFAQQEAKKLQLELEKQQREAERLAKLEAEKAQRESDRLAKLGADRLAKIEADKAQREADRLAAQEAKKLQLEAEKAQREADRFAKLELEKQQREADRLAQQEAKKLQLEAEKQQRQADQIAKLEAEKQQRESDKAERESILEAKKAQNNSEKSDKESKLPPLGPK